MSITLSGAMRALCITLALAGSVSAQRTAPVAKIEGRLSVPPAGPAPVNVAVGGTPTTAWLRWDRLSGITGYTVSRAAGSGQPWVSLTPGPMLAETFADPGGLDPRITYLYQVTAVYSDGRIGSTEVAFTPPAPVNPTGFTAKPVGVGQVQLSWEPVAGVAYYAVFGPGSVNGGFRVNGATSHLVTGVPPGTHEWAVASYYEPGPVSSVGSSSKASLTIAPPALSGRYLVTLTGLRALQPSFDDQLSRDGKGDEVYAAAMVRRYDRRTGAIAEWSGSRTLTYGDTHNFGTSRVQAGTFSSTGGIRFSDPIPNVADPADRVGAPSTVAFPLKLWEGTLTDGQDALVISPSLWEEDGSNQSFLIWNQQMEALNPQLMTRPEVQYQITNQRFAPFLFGSSGMNDGVRDAVEMVAKQLFSWMLVYEIGKNIFEVGADRPIGLHRSGLNGEALPNTVIVLTREIIEASLAPLPPGTLPFGLPVAWPRMPKPGVMMIPFIDGEHWFGVQRLPDARYEMYLKVERLP
ncbi:MAG: hypothetical protein ACKVZ0_21940 [Gemmatimonadales bacterium]